MSNDELKQIRDAINDAQTARRAFNDCRRAADDANKQAENAFTRFHCATIHLETLMETIDEQRKYQVNDEWYLPFVQRILGKHACEEIYGEVTSNSLNNDAMLVDVGIARALVRSYVVGHAYKQGCEDAAKESLREATVLFAAAMAQMRHPDTRQAFGQDVTKVPRYVIAQGIVERIVKVACVPVEA